MLKETLPLVLLAQGSVRQTSLAQFLLGAAWSASLTSCPSQAGLREDVLRTRKRDRGAALVFSGLSDTRVCVCTRVPACVSGGMEVPRMVRLHLTLDGGWSPVSRAHSPCWAHGSR